MIHTVKGFGIVNKAEIDVFPVVSHKCESWTVKKTDRRRTDAFELWCWRRLLKFPWTARKYNQAILKEISREYSLEGPMLKLNKLREMVKNRKTWCAAVHGVIKRMT